MRDYKELVERLHKRIALTSAGSPCQEDLLEAADAIEELLSSAQPEREECEEREQGLCPFYAG